MKTTTMIVNVVMMTKFLHSMENSSRCRLIEFDRNEEEKTERNTAFFLLSFCSDSNRCCVFLPLSFVMKYHHLLSTCDDDSRTSSYVFPSFLLIEAKRLTFLHFYFFIIFADFSMHIGEQC